MPARSHWGKTPQGSVEILCAARGKDQVVAGCIDLLRGADVDGEFILALGGPPAHWAVSETEQPGPDYWLRVWALRGLLWAWDDSAESAVLRALSDDAWRVREMAVRVAARHHIGAALPLLAELQQDARPRVQTAARRAVVSVTNASR
jgi:HEAT repeat protein